MYNKILVAVDGSDSSKGSIDLAKNLAKQGMTESITIISVAPAATIPVETLDLVITEPTRYEKVANVIVEKAEESFKNDGISVDKVVVTGDPGIAISKYASDNNFDLILMGSRGLSGVKGIMLGSVSHKVLHTADCPVLIYRG